LGFIKPVREGDMKVLAFSGSPRREGNTKIVLRHTLEPLTEAGFETEIIDLFDYDVKPCLGCNDCRKKEYCPIDDDLIPLYEKMKASDGIILASPVYFCAATPPLKALIDRTGYIARNNGYVFQGKAGGPIAVTAREGANFALAQINFWFSYNGLIVPGSSSWNVVLGEEIGEVLKDSRGLGAVRLFGQNLARLIYQLKK